MIINRGISFGLIFPGILFLSGILLIVLVFWLLKEKSFGLLLIVGGGIWNFGERALIGGVKDYWKIPLTNIYNNPADWLIFIGLLIFVWQKLKSK